MLLLEVPWIYDGSLILMSPSHAIAKPSEPDQASVTPKVTARLELVEQTLHLAELGEIPLPSIGDRWRLNSTGGGPRLEGRRADTRPAEQLEGA